MTTHHVALGPSVGVLPGRLASGFRRLVAVVYLLGAPTHVYFGTFDPDGYQDMATWSSPWLDLADRFWTQVFMPNARAFAFVIAAFELSVGLLLISRDADRVRIGIAGAALFHLGLLMLFGMWPYTVPMLIALLLLLRYDFDQRRTS